MPTFGGRYFGGARDLFEAAREASRDAERCASQLAEMEARSQSLGGGGGGPKVSTTPDPQRQARRSDARVDREAALERRQREDYDLIDLACAVLYGDDSDGGLSSLVPTWWCDVLWWRYLDGASWKRVSKAVGYSSHRCWEVAQTAIEVCDGWGLVNVACGSGVAEV